MNILLIMSDEHSNQVMGCSGHEIVKTPNLDKLASQGAIFRNCYSNSPICSPARASFFTGQYANRLGVWDNALSYDGQVEGMSQYMQRHGKSIESYGKWDFHPKEEYPGMNIHIPTMRINPQYEACYRDTNITSPGGINRFQNMGPRNGASYDDEVLKGALKFLEARQDSQEPWILYAGFLHPHFPFKTTKSWWEYYEEQVKELSETAKEPYNLIQPLKKLHRFFSGDEVDSETVLKAHIGYYAMVSELDENIGVLMDALEKSGMDKETLVIYTSDHGEQLGHHGLWWKCCMYEESANVPLIIKGPGIQPGTVIDAPASLVDVYPTLCEALEIPIPEGIDGQSLYSLATGRGKCLESDFAFSEYHGHGMESAMYMIRWGKWKYVYYVDFGKQLFDLEKDPLEMEDLAARTDEEEIQFALDECHKRLQSVCNPEEIDRIAKADQQKIRRALEQTGFTKDDFHIDALSEPPRPVKR